MNLRERRTVPLPTVQEYCGHIGSVNSVDFSPCGKWIVSGSSDRTVRLWEVGSHVQRSFILGAHNGSVIRVKFSPSGSKAASVSTTQVIVWDVKSGQKLACFSPSTRFVDIAFSPDGSKLATIGMYSDSAIIWSMDDFQEVSRWGQGVIADHVVFSPCGRFVVSAHCDNSVFVHDLSLGTDMHYPNPKTPTAAVFSMCGQYLFSATDESPINAWNRETHRSTSVSDHSHSRKTYYSLVPSPCGRFLVAACHKLISFIDISFDVIVFTLEYKSSGKASFAFSTCGRFVVSNMIHHVDRVEGVGRNNPVCVYDFGEPFFAGKGVLDEPFV